MATTVMPEEELPRQEERFQTGLLTLQAWLEENPARGLPPQNLRLEDGYRLGQWVLHQRQRHAAGTLSVDRVEALEALPGWTWSRSVADRWHAVYDDVAAVAARTGTAVITPGTLGGSTGRDLAAWAHAQRALHLDGRLARERIDALQSLPGWTWATPRDARWETGLKALRRFVKEHGHASPGSTVRLGTGEKVGAWVGSQRAAYRAGRLPDSRITVLEALPGWTWTPLAGAP